MKWVPFILKHLRRNPIRTASTAMGIAVCIFLFCTLQTFVASLHGSLSQSTTRLITRNSVSRFVSLPKAYEERIAAVPGVVRVAAANYFGGMRDVNNPDSEFENYAVEAENFLAMYPEYMLTDADKRAFLGDQHGCIIGRALAEQFHWKPGDTIQLTSNIYRAGNPFGFVISAIYATDQARYPGTDDAALFFHHKYLEEATGNSAGVRVFNIQIAERQQAGIISHAIDDLFENSDAQTHTETEAQYSASMGILSGNLVLLLNGIGLAVMFTILLVTANTMSMVVRERHTEIGVLKTLGFSGGLVLSLVLAEGIVLGVSGATIGLLLGRFLIDVLPYIPVIGNLVRLFPKMNVPPVIAAGGMISGMSLGLAAGLFPSVFAYRARITELLRRV
jgi:putative ABC transport system permease protein